MSYGSTESGSIAERKARVKKEEKKKIKAAGTRTKRSKADKQAYARGYRAGHRGDAAVVEGYKIQAREKLSDIEKSQRKEERKKRQREKREAAAKAKGKAYVSKRKGYSQTAEEKREKARKRRHAKAVAEGRTFYPRKAKEKKS
jgi:hypothetical protein